MIIHVVNSHLTRKGNFGVRAKRICEELEKRNVDFFCISRGGGVGSSRYVNLTIFGFVARLLNFVRLRVYSDFNHRKYERWLFEFFVLLELKGLPLDGGILHLWEYSEKLIKYAHSCGAKVFLEVPNVTQNYIAKTLLKLPDLRLSYFEGQMIAEKRAIEAADLVIVPSRFVFESVYEMSPESHIKFIAFGFPPCRPARKSARGQERLRLLFVGNVDERKGVPIILEALRISPDLDCELRLLGRLGGMKREVLKSDPRVEYLGFGDPASHYEWADVFVFPSWCEGSAKVVYEAMANGLAVITTASAGSLITHNQDGILIDAGDAVNLSKVLYGFSKSRALIRILGDNAQTTARSRPWVNYVHDIAGLYSTYL